MTHNFTKHETEWLAVIAARCASRVRRGAAFTPELVESEMVAQLNREAELAEGKTEFARKAQAAMARRLWLDIRADSA